MARNAAQRRGPGWLKLLSLGLVVVVGLGAAAIIVPPMLFEPSADVALIKADEAPFKVKPQDPGGIEIPHTETTVMGMIDDLRQPEDATEVMRPPSAVPEMPPPPVDESGEVTMAPEPQPAAPAAGTDGQSGNQSGNQSSGASSNASNDTTAGMASDDTAETSGDASSVTANSGGSEQQAETVSDAAAVEASTGNVTTAMPQSKPAPPKRVVVEGDEPLYVVQLAAFRKADTAREQAGLLAGKHKSRLDGAGLGTMKTDTGDDGIFWRVVTEPMARADADQVCAALKRAGQDCILRKFKVDG